MKKPFDSNIKKAMPCFYEDICSRKTDSNELLKVNELKSIFIFLYTCWGILLDGGLYNVETSLAYQLAGSPYNASFASTYSMS